jgi:hypothetical protein
LPSSLATYTRPSGPRSIPSAPSSSGVAASSPMNAPVRASWRVTLSPMKFATHSSPRTSVLATAAAGSSGTTRASPCA